MSPKTAADFRALAVSGDEPLCSDQIKVFLKGSVNLYILLKYLMDADGAIGKDWAADICSTTNCPPTPPTPQ